MAKKWIEFETCDYEGCEHSRHEGWYLVKCAKCHQWSCSDHYTDHDDDPLCWQCQLLFKIWLTITQADLKERVEGALADVGKRLANR